MWRWLPLALSFLTGCAALNALEDLPVDAAGPVTDAGMFVADAASLAPPIYGRGRDVPIPEVIDLAVANIDGDSANELLAATEDGRLIVVGALGQAELELLRTPGQLSQMSVVDLDRDGKDDLIGFLGSLEVFIITDLTQRPLRTERIPLDHASLQDVSVGQVDPGPRDDLALAILPSGVLLLSRDGSGGDDFGGSEHMLPSARPVLGAQLTDADADGMDDLLFLQSTSEGTSILFSRRTSEPNDFEPPVEVFGLDTAAGRGAMRQLIVSPLPTGRDQLVALSRDLHVIRFGSNGIPQVTTTTLKGVAHGFRCVMADATGDGVADAFVIAPDVITVIPGQRSGAFEPERKEVLDAVDHGAVAVGDLDQDGRPDVATVQLVLTPAFWQQPSTVVRLYLTGEP